MFAYGQNAALTNGLEYLNRAGNQTGVGKKVGLQRSQSSPEPWGDVHSQALASLLRDYALRRNWKFRVATGSLSSPM